MLSAFVAVLLAMAPGATQPVHLGNLSGSVYRDCGGEELRRVQVPSMWQCQANLNYYLEVRCLSEPEYNMYSVRLDLSDSSRRREVFAWLVRCER